MQVTRNQSNIGQRQETNNIKETKNENENENENTPEETDYGQNNFGNNQEEHNLEKPKFELFDSPKSENNINPARNNTKEEKLNNFSKRWGIEKEKEDENENEKSVSASPTKKFDINQFIDEHNNNINARSTVLLNNDIEMKEKIIKESKNLHNNNSTNKNDLIDEHMRNFKDRSTVLLNQAIKEREGEMDAEVSKAPQPNKNSGKEFKNASEITEILNHTQLVENKDESKVKEDRRVITDSLEVDEKKDKEGEEEEEYEEEDEEEEEDDAEDGKHGKHGEEEEEEESEVKSNTENENKTETENNPNEKSNNDFYKKKNKI